MCLIAYQEAGNTQFTRELLENGWRENPHGAGYMWADGDKVVIRKPFYKLKSLVKAYEKDHAAHGANSPFVVHFRWATHGTNEGMNIHPHELADGKAGLVHNGILSNFLPPWKSELSDTAWFCRTVLMARTPEQLVNVEFGNALAEMIGGLNKLVILAHDGGAIIINHDAGEYSEDRQRWFSNGDWKATPKATVSLANSKPGSGDVARGQVFPDKDKLPRHYAQSPIGDGYFEEIYAGDTVGDPIADGEDYPAEIEALSPEERAELEDCYNAAWDHLADERGKNLQSNADWDKLDEDAWKLAIDAMVRDSE